MLISLNDESKNLQEIEFFEPDPNYQEDSAKLQKSIENNKKVAKELNEELAKLLIKYATN